MFQPVVTHLRPLFAALALAGALVPVLARGTGAPVPAPVEKAQAAAPAPSPRDAAAASAKTDLQARLAQLMKQAPRRSGAWVFDATGGETLYGRGSGRQLIPASNMKILTTAAAFSRFGAHANLETTVWQVGTVSGSTLNGDLFLVGGGDPALASPRFGRRRTHGVVTSLAPLAAAVRAAGIRKVTGRLFADDTVFDRVRGVADSRNRVSSYIGPLSGLDFNSGYPAKGGGFAADPAMVAAAQMVAVLRQQGVKVSAKTKRKRLPGAASGRVQLAAVPSPGMTRLIRETNLYSNNHWAEMLLKDLGAGFRGKGTTKAGAKVVRDFLASVGIGGFRQVDGSGLSRPNAIAPVTIGQVLEAMLMNPDAAEWKSTLPLAGSEGTLRRRMRGTAAAGRCRAKTGTLRDVSSLSGYCFGAGRTMIFSIVMNDVRGAAAAHKIQDRMVAAIAGY